MVRAQLREDGDHDAAELVPAVGGLLVGDRLLELLQRLLRPPLVPGVEGRLELVGAGAVLAEGKLRAGGETVRDEVVREGTQQLQRLAGLTAGERGAGEPDRRLGVAWVELVRLAQ